MRLIVAITGASGAIYGKRLIEALKERGVEVHLIVSESARFVVEHELDDPRILEGMADRVYDPRNLSAPVTSGSFRVDGMVIVPASMKTVAAIASGYCENLVARAADVQLKERRPLIVVPRETPLNAIHLENMLKLHRAGAIILPASPAFYHKPQNLQAVVDYVVGRVLEVLGVEHRLYPPWSRQ